MVDECHGHFGAIDESGEVTYHYHTSDEYMGPSVSRCNEIVSDDFDDGANWVSQGLVCCSRRTKLTNKLRPTPSVERGAAPTCASSRACRRMR